MKRKFRGAVFIVVYSKTKEGIKYLILKRRLHWRGWEFPKGKIEFPEGKNKTAEREVKEETGLNAFNIKRHKYSGKYLYDRILRDRPQYRGQSFILFSAEVKKREIKISKEHSDFKWLSFEKAIKKLTWSNQKKSLKIVNTYLRNGKRNKIQGI